MDLLTIQVQDHEFIIDPERLISKSEYFRGLLRGGFKEQNTTRIRVEDTPKEFELFLSAIHGSDSRSFGTIERYLKYNVKDFDLETMIKGIVFPKDQLMKFLDIVSTIYPEQIPEPILNEIGRLISEGYELTELSDETIIELITSCNVKIRNLYRFFERIHNLVIKGHSSILYELIDSALLQPEMYEQIRLIPKLSFINKDCVLMIMKTPFGGWGTYRCTDSKITYDVSFMNSNKLTAGNIIQVENVRGTPGCMTVGSWNYV